MLGSVSSSLQIGLPVIHIVDSNDTGWIYLNIEGSYTAFEADLVAYIKTKIAAVPGAGTIAAVKATTMNTSV